MFEVEPRLHIYTGDGKGKTTAALGLALRAAGRGMRSFIGQFMKGSDYGELHSIEQIPEIEIVQLGWQDCINKEDVGEFHREKSLDGLALMETKASSGLFDLLILDEACIAVWFGLLDETDLYDFIMRHRSSHEIILTGRHAPEKLLEEADLVTRMNCERHYFNEGVTARKGIEF